MAVDLSTAPPVMCSRVVKVTTINATKKAVKGGAGDCRAFTFDNTANSAASYVRMYDTAIGSVTVGTTAVDFLWGQAASTSTTIVIATGWVFATAITVACVTEAGETGTTSPSAATNLTVATTS